MGNNAEDRRDDTDQRITVATSETDFGYVVEARIPWGRFDDFTVTRSQLEAFRFDLSVNDGRGSGGASGAEIRMEPTGPNLDDTTSPDRSGPRFPDKFYKRAGLEPDDPSDSSTVVGEGRARLVWNNDGRTDNASTRDSYGDILLPPDTRA